jgi:hypothetical protein
LTGFLFDLDMSRIDPKFLDEVAQALAPGKAALLAEVDESSTTRIDERLRKLGARRLPAEIIEDQLVAESAGFEAKLKALDRKLEQALAENRAAIQKDIEDARKQRKAAQAHARARLEAKAEMAAKLKVLQDQAEGAGERAKAQIERRMTDLKANLDLRSGKLSQASTVSNEG